MNLGMETELVELKKTTGELKEGIVSLVSMLNKNGKGTLYFGVRNDGEIVGQQIGDRTIREISQSIANAIKPQIIPTIIMELCDDKNIIKVNVEGDEKPYGSFLHVNHLCPPQRFGSSPGGRWCLPVEQAVLYWKITGHFLLGARSVGGIHTSLVYVPWSKMGGR